MLFIDPLRGTGQPMGGGATPTEGNQQPQIATTGDAPGLEPETGDEGNGGKRLVSQAELDRIVEDRLSRERAKAEKLREKERREAEAATLAANSEFQTLAQKRQERVLELEAMVTDREALAEKTARYERALTAQRDQLIAKVPTAIKALLEKMDIAEQIEWLAQNAAAVGGTPPPNLPNTPNGAKPNLTPAEMRQQKHFSARF